jgi:hypothetical protein
MSVQTREGFTPSCGEMLNVRVLHLVANFQTRRRANGMKTFVFKYIHVQIYIIIPK